MKNLKRTIEQFRQDVEKKAKEKDISKGRNVIPSSDWEDKAEGRQPRRVEKSEGQTSRVSSW